MIYWSVTGFFALAQSIPGFMNFFVPSVAERFAHLGYPQHLRIMLGFAEILGALSILLPNVAFRIKEWAYAGFVFLYISAFVAHIVAGDGIGLILQAPITFVVLAISYIYFHKLNKVFADKI
ncbi:MAG: DoxX family protein [Cyanobacteriota bacterium]